MEPELQFSSSECPISSLYIVPDPYSPNITAQISEDLFSFFPLTYVQVFKLCSRICYSHQNVYSFLPSTAPYWWKEML